VFFLVNIYFKIIFLSAKIVRRLFFCEKNFNILIDLYLLSKNTVYEFPRRTRSFCLCPLLTVTTDTKFRDMLRVTLASVLAGLVSWMDMLITAIAAVGLCCLMGWQDRAQLYSGCTAGHGQDNRMLFLLPSLVSLDINSSGELGHRLHTLYSPYRIHYHLFHRGYAMGQKLWRGLSIDVPTVRPPPHNNTREWKDIVPPAFPMNRPPHLV